MSLISGEINDQNPDLRQFDLLPVRVRIEVEVGGAREVFDAQTATTADGFDIAKGMLDGARESAHRWLGHQGRESRGGAF